MTTLHNRPHTALLVVDVQNDVVAGTYRRDDVVGIVGALVQRARHEGVPVIWVQHSDAQLVPGRRRLADRPRVGPRRGRAAGQKHHGDSFEDTPLESVLAGLGVGRLVVAGAQTDACVRSTRTARSSGATTPRWSATPTPRRTERRGGLHRPSRSSRTPTSTGPTRRPRDARPARSRRRRRLRRPGRHPSARPDFAGATGAGHRSGSCPQFISDQRHFVSRTSPAGRCARCRCTYPITVRMCW